MRKSFYIFMILLLVFLAACAAPQEAPTEEPEVVATEEVVEPEVEEAVIDTSVCGTDEEVTITYVGDPVDTAKEAELATIARFNEHCPNITVNRIDGEASTTDLMASYLTVFEAEASDLDVIRVDVVYPGVLAEHLLDLKPYTPQEQLDSYIPSLLVNNTVDGRLVALPIRLGFGMLYYRTDLLEKYGFENPPTTWEELAEMAQTIQDGERAEGNADFWGFVWQGDAYEGLTCNAMEWQVSNGGGAIVNPEGVVEVNNEASIAAFERAAGWVGTISPEASTGFQEGDSNEVWSAGNAAFMRYWPGAYATSQQSEAIAGKFATAPLPAGASGQGASTMGGWEIGVSRYSAHPEAAAAFAVYMTGAENAKYYAIDTTFPPVILSLYDDPDIQAAVPYASPEIVSIVSPRPSTVTADKYNEVSSLYFTAVHSILTGESDAATALEMLELDLQALMSGVTVPDEPEPEAKTENICGTTEEVTITYVGDPVDTAKEAELATIARFNEYCPNVTVNRIDGEASTTDLMASYLTVFEAQASDLDVIRVDVVYPGVLAQHLLDLKPYTPQEQLDSYIPSLLVNNTVNGELVALPIRLGFGMLYYRTDLLEKYGFENPPATWEELASMAQTIQDGERAEGNADFWGFVWQGDAYEGLTCNAMEWQVSNGGGVIVNPEGVVEVNNEASIAAFERAAGWVGTISPEAVTGFQEGDSNEVWSAGNAAFMRYWPGAYATSQQSEAIAGKFATAPLPAGASGKGASTMGGWEIGVSRYSAHPEAAAAFAVFMTGAENAKYYAIDTTFPPVILSLYDDPDIQAAVPYASPEIVSIVSPRPSTVTADKYNEVSSLYFTAIHSILTGESDAATALEMLELDLQALLAE